MSIQRRGFFKLLAIGAVATAAGALTTSCSSTTSATIDNLQQTHTGARQLGYSDIAFGQKVDVLIVGSGAAGLSAAMAPSEAGKKVLIVDKNSLLGGDSFNATGIMHVKGTELQQKTGLSGTADDAWHERKQGLSDVSDPTMLKLLENICRAKTDWVNSAISHYKSLFADPATYVSSGTPEDVIMCKPSLGSMENVLTPIRDQLSMQGVSFRLNLTATYLIVDSNNIVSGVRFFAPDTFSNVDIAAEKVIVATGGFSANGQMMHQNLPGQEHIGSATYLADGSGSKLCQLLNTTTTDMSKEANLASDIPVVGGWGLFGPIVAVGPDAKRFAREDQQFACSNACQWRGLGYWWSIFDNQLASGVQASSIAKITQKQGNRYVGACDSTDALAQATGLSASQLKDTLSTYNSAANKGDDADFGKKSFLRPLSSPLYAFKQYPVRIRTIGGMRTDDNARLMNTSGATVQNVFCCGSCAAGRSEGMLDDAAFGLIAGRTATAELS